MKLKYYAYCLENEKTRYKAPIRSLLTEFAKISDKDVKNSFSISGEKIYLFRERKVFLLIQTRSEEIIHAINTQKVTHSDVYKRLQENESLGFGSYIYIGDGFFAIASTVKGPKTKSFETFVNDLFQRIGFPFTFRPIAMMTETTPQEIEQEMQVIGRTMIDLNRDHPSLRNVLSNLTNMVNPSSFDDVDSLTIIIKPTPRKKLNKNTFSAVNRAIAQYPEGIRNYMVKAKSDIDENLSDYYLLCSGQLADSIKTKVKSDIPDNIVGSVETNTYLESILNKTLKENHVKNHAELHSLNGFTSNGNLVDILLGHTKP